MALSPSQETVVRAENLVPVEDWHEVGRGGFGWVYKARHKDWGFDVAVKIFKQNTSHMFKEARFMDLASHEFVLRVYGIFEGPSGQRGLVTEYMKRGSVETLQKQMSGTPPWPLAFRLAHQIALAINFLHLKNIVHLDLKPNNILLDDMLNAKLADFGLSKVSMSAVVKERSFQDGPQGTFAYMPPEAFKILYKPVRAFDTYSYGILLWAIFTGKEPYQGAMYSLVELRIPEGDRPPCEDLLNLQVEGITDVVGLMKNCWDMNPDKRPHFKDCLKITERLFSRHSSGIQQTVNEVLTILDSPNHQGAAKINDVVDQASVIEVKLASLNISDKTMTRKEKAKFVDHHRPALIQRVSHVLAIAEELGDMVHKETYSKIRAKETNEDRLRVLYCATLTSGGEKVSAAFYDALKKHEPYLMEDLESQPGHSK